MTVEILIVQSDRATKDARGRALNASLPKPIADHNDGRRAYLILVLTENVRPISGETPTTLKKFRVTEAHETRSGSRPGMPAKVS